MKHQRNYDETRFTLESRKILDRANIEFYARLKELDDSAKEEIIVHHYLSDNVQGIVVQLWFECENSHIREQAEKIHEMFYQVIPLVPDVRTGASDQP